VRIAEVVNLAADTQRIKAQQSAAKMAAKNARRAALQLKLRKTQQQLADLNRPPEFDSLRADSCLRVLLALGFGCFWMSRL
jgi:hypothetical protein